MSCPMKKIILWAGLTLGIIFLAYTAISWLQQMQQQANAAGVRVPQLNAVQKAGRNLFDANCAACHGKNAAGGTGNAPPLVHLIYEPNHHGDMSFYRAALLGVRQHHWPFGDMPPVEGVTEDDVTKIIAYVRAIQKENGIF